jgi:hypothetical protein
MKYGIINSEARRGDYGGPCLFQVHVSTLLPRETTKKHQTTCASPPYRMAGIFFAPF